MKKWSFIALLIFGAAILGATVLREPIASAAQTTAATIVGPVDGNGNVKVHEQGTANVNVTNSSLLVTPPSPITSGGGGFAHSCPDSTTLPSTQVATALSIHMESGVAEVNLDQQLATPVVRFAGPAAAGNSSVVLALPRPVAFNRIHCIGTGAYSVSWVGNSP